MNDLISRQAAIDYVKEQRGRVFTGCTIEEGMITMILEVPTADVTNCKSCKYKKAVEEAIRIAEFCEQIKKVTLSGWNIE